MNARVKNLSILGLSLALASTAGAKTVSIDFTGASPVSQGLTQVNQAPDKDGATTIAQDESTSIVFFPLAGAAAGASQPAEPSASTSPLIPTEYTVSG